MPTTQHAIDHLPAGRVALIPHVIRPVLSLQDARQRAGWHITAFDMPKVWERSRGKGVRVAVLDTGVDLTHPDLVRNLESGYNVLNPSEPPLDRNSHGTHVAGIICAECNDIGVVGVAPEAHVIPIKVLDDEGFGDTRNVAKGIRKALELGADILCLSLGSPTPDAIIHRAIKEAAAKHVPCVVAAGNAGQTRNVYYPANYPQTIAIGSIDRNMRRSDFSNTGDNLDFLAPGGSILSTVPPHWYAVMDGTSMAAPWVAGVLALMLSSKLAGDPGSAWGTVAEVREQLRLYAVATDDPRTTGKVFFEGFGILDPRLWINTPTVSPVPLA